MSASSPQRLARLLALVPWLSRHEGVTIAEAADHFGITPEDLEKDLWLVVCCGLPGHGPDQLIDIQFWEEDGVIDVLDPQTLVAPTRLTVEEAASLQVGLTILAGLADDEDRELIDTTMAALSRTADMAGDAMPGVGSPTQPLRTDLGVDPMVADAVQRAVAASCALRIEYYGATRDAITDRIIWPDRLVISGSMAYLEAWCTDAQDRRTFRIDRIRAAHLIPETDTPPQAAGDARSARGEERVPPGPRVHDADGEPTTVTVAIHRDARWIIDSYGFEPLATDRSPAAEGLPEEWIEATIEVWDPRWLVRTILGMGGQVIVRSPDRVRGAVLEAARRALHETG